MLKSVNQQSLICFVSEIHDNLLNSPKFATALLHRLLTSYEKRLTLTLAVALVDLARKLMALIREQLRPLTPEQELEIKVNTLCYYRRGNQSCNYSGPVATENSCLWLKQRWFLKTNCLCVLFDFCLILIFYDDLVKKYLFIKRNFSSKWRLVAVNIAC